MEQSPGSPSILMCPLTHYIFTQAYRLKKIEEAGAKPRERTRKSNETIQTTSDGFRNCSLHHYRLSSATRNRVCCYLINRIRCRVPLEAIATVLGISTMPIRRMGKVLYIKTEKNQDPSRIQARLDC